MALCPRRAPDAGRLSGWPRNQTPQGADDLRTMRSGLVGHRCYTDNAGVGRQLHGTIHLPLDMKTSLRYRTWGALIGLLLGCRPARDNADQVHAECDRESRAQSVEPREIQEDPMKKPVSVWVVSFALCTVSLEGLWSLPNVLSSLETTSQYLVAVSHVVYVIAGFLIVLGIWRSIRLTWIAVIVWGIASLGAAIGGPLTFGPTTATHERTIVAMTIVILLLTSGLLWYVRRITRAGA